MRDRSHMENGQKEDGPQNYEQQDPSSPPSREPGFVVSIDQNDEMKCIFSFFVFSL